MREKLRKITYQDVQSALIDAGFSTLKKTLFLTKFKVKEDIIDYKEASLQFTKVEYKYETTNFTTPLMNKAKAAMVEHITVPKALEGKMDAYPEMVLPEIAVGIVKMCQDAYAIRQGNLNDFEYSAKETELVDNLEKVLFKQKECRDFVYDIEFGFIKSETDRKNRLGEAITLRKAYAKAGPNDAKKFEDRIKTIEKEDEAWIRNQFKRFKQRQLRKKIIKRMEGIFEGVYMLTAGLLGAPITATILYGAISVTKILIAYSWKAKAPEFSANINKNWNTESNVQKLRSLEATLRYKKRAYPLCSQTKAELEKDATMLRQLRLLAEYRTSYKDNLEPDSLEKFLKDRNADTFQEGQVLPLLAVLTHFKESKVLDEEGNSKAYKEDEVLKNIFRVIDDLDMDDYVEKVKNNLDSKYSLRSLITKEILALAWNLFSSLTKQNVGRVLFATAIYWSLVALGVSMPTMAIAFTLLMIISSPMIKSIDSYIKGFYTRAYCASGLFRDINPYVGMEEAQQRYDYENTTKVFKASLALRELGNMPKPRPVDCHFPVWAGERDRPYGIV